jgi:hypothetical protein
MSARVAYISKLPLSRRNVLARSNLLLYRGCFPANADFRTKGQANGLALNFSFALNAPPTTKAIKTRIASIGAARQLA